MKIRKLLRTWMASALAALLLVSALPALANPTTGDGETPVTSFTITKNLTKGDKDMTPNVSFSFQVAAAVAGEETRNGVPVSNGVDGGVTVSTTNGTADFAPGETLDSNTTLSDTVDFDVHGNLFTVPGIYKYTITEVQGNRGGISYDANVLSLYVYVQNGTDGLYVAYTELVDPDGSAEGTEAKVDSFTNTYEVNDLVVYKVISGNAANMNEKFSFTLKIDGEAGEKYYVEVGTYGESGFTATEGAAHFVLTSGTEHRIQLGNNDAVKIYGLDSDDTYTITEADANTNGYSLKINDAAEADEDGAISGSITGDSVVKFENTKSTTTPTGIIMDIAPYALMVIIALAAVVVFKRKGSEE